MVKRLWHGYQNLMLHQRGHLFPWVPILLACGIGLYFSVRFEPDQTLIALAIGLAGALTLAAWKSDATIAPLLWALALILAGGAIASLRAHWVAGPVLGWRYYGPVEGRVIAIDRSASDAVRLTLDGVILRNIAPNRTPHRVRVSLHGDEETMILAGTRIAVTAHLSPPSGPVEPGGFDFRRQAWFNGLGAIGYSRTPVMIIYPPRGITIAHIRLTLSRIVQTALPGEAGAFAAAIMTGDRSAMSQDTLNALRASNLAHLLAISGLHMGLLAGFVFAFVRGIFAAIPYIGLRLPGKKIAALIALMAAAGYLLLSGGNVATERAFVMVAVMLVAVILDRRALSLRAVALAALIVLCLRPETLLGPGFQMSFAATTALVAVFGAIRDQKLNLGPGWLRPIATVVISSTVAGLATAPVGAAHFNQIAHFGLIANLASVPLMGVMIMPAGVFAVLLMPLGLDGLPFAIMGLGLDWILWVAHSVADLPGARGQVPSPHWLVLPLLGFGGLVLILWQGRSRIVGLAPILVAALLWAQTDRPDILIADTGGLVGVMTPEGRALSKPKGAGFIAQNWLENDGDPRDQITAAALWPSLPPIRHVTGKAAIANLTCAATEIVVVNADPPAALGCYIYAPRYLAQTGAIAIYHSPKGQKIVTANDQIGQRLWTPKPPNRKP